MGATNQANMAINQGSRAGPRVYSALARHEQAETTDWTVELVFYFDWKATNTFYLLSLTGGTDGGYPFSSIIDLWWQGGPGTGYLWARLRNRYVPPASNPDEMIILTGAPDNRWHHLAVVKNSTRIYTYLDYSPVYSTDLGSHSRDNYYFNGGTRAGLGMLSTNPATGYWIHDSVLVDEVRVTGAALSTNSFLRTTRPVINGFDEFASSTQVYLRVAGMPGKTYPIERSADMLTWMAHTNWRSAQLQQDVAIPMPNNPRSPAFFRIRNP